MQASPAKVIEYFNGEKQNLIPLFQRPYSWQTSNLKTLWDDVMVQYDLEENSTHFMGAIVSVPAKTVPVGVSKYLIIDGQQRLTTISLLLCALRDVVDENNANRIQEVYLTNKFRDQEDLLKFVPTQIDRANYRSLVVERQVPKVGGNLMVDAYKFFIKSLKTGVDNNGDAVVPEKVLTTLEHSLQVVMINLGDTDDPYLIFESLNFKGEPLRQADLVRNYLLMRFRHSITAGGEQEEVYQKYWNPMELLLGESLTDFLRYYAMKDGENIYLGGIYAATKNRLSKLHSTDEVKAEAGIMVHFAELYKRIISPEREENGVIRRRLENIKSLDVATSYPLIMRLMNEWTLGELDQTELEKCLIFIESFVVRRAMCEVPTNSLNKLFLQWSKNFPPSGYERWLCTAMSSGGGGRRFPSDDEFSEAFTTRAQYGRGATRFVLVSLERSFGHKEPVDLATTTIEHVLPQTLTDEWRALLGEKADNIYARLINTMGNLTLSGYNPELGNMDFVKKKIKYLESHIELSRSIAECSNWGETEIVGRAQQLFSRAKVIWPGPVAP